MAIREIAVKSLGDLIDKVTPAAPDPDTGRRRYSGVYHGAIDAALPLLTSLDRLGGTHPPHTKAALEGYILRSFVRYGRPYLRAQVANEWEMLVVAQHHGLPTRLLDWSYSPLIAAHFATAGGDRAVDRAVWRLDWKAVHRAFGLPELALLIQDLDGLFDTGGTFTPWVLFNAPPEVSPFACLVEPPSLDARIVVQAASFTLCSDKTQSFDGFLESHGLDEALTKLVIPAGIVADVRDQLDLAGIDERRLFPGLDGIAAQMRRYYS